MEGDGIFPHSPTLEEVREAVADTEEFKFSKYTEDDGSELIFYNYRFCTPRTFPPVSEAADPRQKRLFLIRRECRGLVYRVRPDGTSELVARMFHKFFNVGERPDTHESLLDLSRPHDLLVKHDGSLVAPVLSGKQRQVRWATKSGLTSVAELMEDRFLSKNPHYADFARQWLEKGLTPLFEWCSLRNKIVLEYDNDNLILLGIRHNASGLYLPYSEVRKAATESNISVTERLELDKPISSADDLLAGIKSRENIEGFVIFFTDSSEMFKVKTEWYFARSKALQKSEHLITTERGIWNTIIGQTLDDTAPLMDPFLRESVSKFAVQLFEALGALHRRVKEFAIAHIQGTKGEFVKALKAKNDPAFPDGLCYKMFDTIKAGGAEDSWEVVQEWCLANTGTIKALDKMREAFGGLKFSEKGITE